MAQVKQGDTVAINFNGTLDDGTVIDSTYPDPEESCDCESGDHTCDDGSCCQDPGPYELTLGEGEFFPSIEDALIGMAPGEKKTIVIPAADAFGEYDPENVFSVPRGEFPDDEINPEVGLELEVTGDNGEVFVATIVEVSDEQITLDTNHPLAGEDLTYEFELVEIL
ncbi:MAG: peptidylprolyl isomerase [Desulfuromonas sp.]|nr:MAG: peptidylprolyl isomerase [Desulfuromonas sp.]